MQIERKLSHDEWALSRSEILEAMGDALTHHSEGDPLIREVDALYAEAVSCALPRYTYLFVPGTLDRTAATLTLGAERKSLFQVGKIIAHQLQDATLFLIFTATVGEEFDLWMEQLKREGDMLKVYIADAIGSALVEKVADLMEADLQSRLDSVDLHHTLRFSPGYCGWHLSGQKELFSLFPSSTPCGIRLTESCLMLPIKSVSGVIGVGKEVKPQQYSCGLCDYAMCYKRRQHAKN